jgi:ubiquinol-cytochrome c reductase cytochrome b subunit
MSEVADSNTTGQSNAGWLSRHTALGDLVRKLLDAKPASSFEAWARTTASVVVMLLALQIITGLLLGFYYVPSTESAHTTVAYIEKVVPAGTWIRSLHHYGSMWLTLWLVLHLLQMFWRATYRRRPVGWLACVILIGLIFTSGATGYSLPWDARAFFGTRVTEGIAGGLPIIGSAAREWVLGGAEITPVTLARFFALHVMIIPALILIVIVARLFIFRERSEVRETEERGLEVWRRKQILRNAIAAGVVFLALAVYAWKYFAPLGPPADTAAPGYLPRPGAQFLWLFQMLKYLPGRAASMVAVTLPGLILLGLALLPFLKSKPRARVLSQPARTLGTALFSVSLLLFVVLTFLAYWKDATDPLTRAQLRRQQAEEMAFRAAPFEPLRARASESVMADQDTGKSKGTQTPSDASQSSAHDNPTPNGSTSAASAPPESYILSCSSCHGTRGQGVQKYPKLLGVGSKPHRTVEDITALLNDPTAYGLQPPMKSFADKLTEDEKREIAVWVAGLK